MRKSRKRIQRPLRGHTSEYVLEVTGEDTKWRWEIRNLPQSRSARRAPRTYPSREVAQKEGDEALQSLLRVINDHRARHAEPKPPAD
jgi:hypothetical protein